jgi:hypothetical protein
MVMQKISDKQNESFEGGLYASTEEELYEKAIALLEKCKIATQPTGRKISASESSTAETSPIAV